MADLASMGLSQLPPFRPDEEGISSLAPRWKRWSDRFDNLMTALNVTDNARKKALLLHLAGETVFDIFEGLVVAEIAHDADPAVDNVYTVAKRALDEHFNPKKNIEFERYSFRLAKQNNGESIEAYVVRLRSLAKYCEFANADAEIKSHLIQTCKSSRLRRRALTDAAMTLHAMIDLGRSMEMSERQSKAIEGKPSESQTTSDESVNRVNRKPFFKNRKPSEPSKSDVCRNCGKAYPHPGGRSGCPAFSTACRSCLKIGHWQKMCRSTGSTVPTQRKPSSYGEPRDKPQASAAGRGRGQGQSRQYVRRVDEAAQQQESDSDSDDQYVFTVAQPQPRQPTVNTTMQGTKVKFIIDSGASVNLIDEQTMKRLKQQPQLQRAKANLYTYGSTTPIDIIGKFQTTIETKHKICEATVYVAKGNSGALLSFSTASNLGVVKICINAVDPEKALTIDDVEKMHPELFQGIGKLKDFKVKLHINDDVKPVVQPHRRVPFHLRKKVEEEIKNLLAQGLIEKATGPTPFVSPIVTPTKPNQPDKVRICVDMRLANLAIARERHVIPTLQELKADLNGSIIFSKLDLASGYHQLQLHEDSRYITCFSTHIGLYVYKRLNFGICCASEIFQNAIAQVLRGLPNVINISDDILIYAPSVEIHNATLRAVLKRLAEHGLTLNKQKCELNKREIKFFGHIFSEHGVSVDPARVEIIRNLEPPTSAGEVRSLMGLVSGDLHVKPHSGPGND